MATTIGSRRTQHGIWGEGAHAEGGPRLRGARGQGRETGRWASQTEVVRPSSGLTRTFVSIFLMALSGCDCHGNWARSEATSVLPRWICRCWTKSCGTSHFWLLFMKDFARMAVAVLGCFGKRCRPNPPRLRYKSPWHGKPQLTLLLVVKLPNTTGLESRQPQRYSKEFLGYHR